MAVLNDIRALFAQCPALKDLEARTDQLETDAEGYGIFPAGSAIIEQDMRGAATWQYNFIIAATRMTADDIMRLDNCNFTEELQDWVQQQNRKASLFPGTAFLLSQFPPQTAPLQTGTKISNMVSTKFRAP